jgi:hypothetical protein
MTEKDLEIDAISKVAAALSELNNEERARVVDWAAKKYGVKLTPEAGRRTREHQTAGDGSVGPSGNAEMPGFTVFADLFDAMTPTTEAERALVGGYWFQIVQGQADFQGQQVNNALKDVGHGVSNITVALGKLQNSKPALVRQVAKSGRSRQARKKYKLTTAGISAARAMMEGGGLGAGEAEE